MTITLGKALDDWCEYRARLVVLGLVSESTWENQTKIAGAWKHALGQTMLDALRKSDIEVHVGCRLRFCKAVTVQGEMNVLRQFLNWCLDEQLLAKKPRLPTVKVPAVEEALPSDEAFLWALAAVPVKHQLALEFMMLTGLSPHELERVQVRDWKPSILDPDGDGYVGIGQRADFKVKQESRRRLVPLNSRARIIFEQLAGGSPGSAHPFPGVAAMEKALSRARIAHRDHDMPAGVDKVTPKRMRSWFASKVANDQPEHVLQRLLGHAPGSKITRRHYVRSNDEQLVEAVGAVSA